VQRSSGAEVQKRCRCRGGTELGGAVVQRCSGAGAGEEVQVLRWLSGCREVPCMCIGA